MITMQTFAFHSQDKKRKNIITKCQQVLFVFPSIKTSIEELTYFQCPDSLCGSSLLTDWLIHLTMSTRWIVLHSWILPTDLREVTTGKTSGFRNIKRDVMRGRLNHQIEPQEYTNMDSDLTAKQYRESRPQSKAAALFSPVMFTLSDNLLLSKRDVPLSCSCALITT